MGLNTLKPAEGSRHRKKIIGRGVGSGHGRTSTRGSKGQKARSGDGKMSYFEAGQTAIVRRMPKRGFNNTAFRKEYEIVNLDLIASKFNSDDEITVAKLKEAGLVKKGKLVKILANGNVDKKFNVSANSFSKTAKEKIEKAGGKAVVVEA
ncbi:MAG: 50S ribosomal protein L15 [Endomicrobiaceae bacterium]|nr:50S ribosomal protein L15 [Endomicrobiaceae bacterium]MDD3730369.1 50S ribosomal protein L15 [Endomicrobiaceae bacterium]MDD4166364.1 50S ribosomal protein L15 [Endomicrobiaceae bacterium]